MTLTRDNTLLCKQAIVLTTCNSTLAVCTPRTASPITPLVLIKWLRAPLIGGRHRQEPLCIKWTSTQTLCRVRSIHTYSIQWRELVTGPPWWIILCLHPCPPCPTTLELCRPLKWCHPLMPCHHPPFLVYPPLVLWPVSNLQQLHSLPGECLFPIPKNNSLCICT